MDRQAMIEAIGTAIHERAEQERFCTWDEAAEIALSAIESSGYWIAPLEPTRAMLIDGETAIDNCIDVTSDSYESYEIYSTIEMAGAAYKAMRDHVKGS